MMMNDFMRSLLIEKGFGPEQQQQQVQEKRPRKSSPPKTIIIESDNARLPARNNEEVTKRLSSTSIGSCHSFTSFTSVASFDSYESIFQQQQHIKKESRFSTGDSSDDEIFFTQRRRDMNGRQQRLTKRSIKKNTIKRKNMPVDSDSSDTEGEQQAFVFKYEDDDGEEFEEPLSPPLTPPRSSTTKQVPMSMTSSSAFRLPLLPNSVIIPKQQDNNSESNNNTNSNNGGSGGAVGVDQGQSLVDLIQKLSYQAALSLTRHGDTWIDDQQDQQQQPSTSSGATVTTSRATASRGGPSTMLCAP